MTTQNADYERGYLAGLEEAARLVMSAPLLIHGQRRANVPGGVPRVMDSAVDLDGDPNFVHCDYALRDAILHWLQVRSAQIGWKGGLVIGHSLTLLEDDGGWDFPECSCGWSGPPCPDKEIASEFWADHLLTAQNDGTV